MNKFYKYLIEIYVIISFLIIIYVGMYFSFSAIFRFRYNMCGGYEEFIGYSQYLVWIMIIPLPFLVYMIYKELKEWKNKEVVKNE